MKYLLYQSVLSLRAKAHGVFNYQCYPLRDQPQTAILHHNAGRRDRVPLLGSYRMLSLQKQPESRAQVQALVSMPQMIF